MICPTLTLWTKADERMLHGLTVFVRYKTQQLAIRIFARTTPDGRLGNFDARLRIGNDVAQDF